MVLFFVVNFFLGVGVYQDVCCHREVAVQKRGLMQGRDHPARGLAGKPL
jgi:hypothetical protein